MANVDDLLALGLTYRQIDHWTTQGYLRAEHANPGSGQPRTWPPSQVRVARLMKRLTSAGIKPQAAHHAVTNNGNLGPGVWVTVEGEGGL